jgi:hypothetical protein
MRIKMYTVRVVQYGSIYYYPCDSWTSLCTLMAAFMTLKVKVIGLDVTVWQAEKQIDFN